MPRIPRLVTTSRETTQYKAKKGISSLLRVGEGGELRGCKRLKAWKVKVLRETEGCWRRRGPGSRMAFAVVVPVTGKFMAGKERNIAWGGGNVEST